MDHPDISVSWNDEQLWDWHARLRHRLGDLRLKLHRHKTHLGTCADGVKFLGLILHRNGRRLPQQAILKFSRRIRRLRWMRANRKISFGQIRDSLRSWLVHARPANSAGIRKALWRRLRF